MSSSYNLRIRGLFPGYKRFIFPLTHLLILDSRVIGQCSSATKYHKILSLEAFVHVDPSLGIPPSFSPLPAPHNHNPPILEDRSPIFYASSPYFCCEYQGLGWQQCHCVLIELGFSAHPSPPPHGKSFVLLFIPPWVPLEPSMVPARHTAQ